MEQIQIEELVSELETRVDRLRSLYEQYFMGIEKMEPHVPRKDVERRFQAMRREQIRNTALRFRFQMVLQKYNTYQSYWMRIMRQIEDGTYKRDVLRAKSNLGEKRRSTRPPPPAEKEEAPRVMSPSMVDDFIFDTGAEEGPTRKVEVPTARAQTQSKADLLLEFSPFDEATTKLMVPTGLDVDEDPTGILPLVGNAAGNHGPAAPKARPAADPEKMRQLAARIKGLKNDEPKNQPPPAPNADASSGHKPPPLPPKANAPAMKPPTLPGAIRPLGAPIGMKPPTLPSAIKPAPAAPPPMKPPTLPAAIKPPASPPAMKPPTPPAAKAPVAPPIPMKPPTAPAAMKPLAPPITAPTAAPIPAPAPKGANPSDLSDARVRQIYSQYVDTKRKQNESTTAITYEGVAKSLRESTARLKEKHGNNSVDFEVAVKEGKTILRPVLKKEAPKPPNKDEK